MKDDIKKIIHDYLSDNLEIEVVAPSWEGQDGLGFNDRRISILLDDEVVAEDYFSIKDD